MCAYITCAPDTLFTTERNALEAGNLANITFSEDDVWRMST